MLQGFRIDVDGVEVTGWTRTATGVWSAAGLEVTDTAMQRPDTAVIEKRVVVRNTGTAPVRLTRVDTFNSLLPADSWRLHGFSSSWGAEFVPFEHDLSTPHVLEVRTGRSSNGMHPYFWLTQPDGEVLAAAIAWSGNWVARFEPLPDGTVRVSGGLHDWEFAKVLQPGESMESPDVLFVHLPSGGLDAAAVEFQRFGPRYWHPVNVLHRELPAEWNHWWPYEDWLINEDVFKANVDTASRLGFNVCTLDAGWFGDPGPSIERFYWCRVRGDWETVNLKLFPSGIRHLSDHVHARGMKFGLWCEIEALAPESATAHARPDLCALRDGQPLGYLCLANPDAYAHALATLERLIVDYRADWIKLDFNLDPRAGCNRTDHGHAAGDGLYEHYRAFYRLLDTVRARHPHVLLENCASGGLRIDMGILRHVHTAFLSDPDYPVHNLQLFWGATAMLHPSVCLHWSWSQTTAPHAPCNGDSEPVQPDMPLHKFDYMLRTAMLNGFGCSYRLPELPDKCAERLKKHIDFYRRIVRPFLSDGVTHRLTGQALRDGGGVRWNAFAFARDGVRSILLFVFRLPGAEPAFTCRLPMLAAGGNYEVRFIEPGERDKRMQRLSGARLASDGIEFAGLPEESAVMIRIDSVE